MALKFFEDSAKLAERIHTNLSLECLRYFRGRGLLDGIKDEFYVGTPPTNSTEMKKVFEGVPYGTLRALGLYTVSEEKVRSPFIDRIIFPVENARGQVVAFAGRRMNDVDLPKYLNSPEHEHHKRMELLFNLNRALPVIRDLRTVYLVEGYFDVFHLHQSGFRNVVATFGTSVTEYQIYLLKMIGCKVVGLFDGDSAGQLANEKVAQLCETYRVPYNGKILPDGYDPARICQEHGRVGLIDIIKQKA